MRTKTPHLREHMLDAAARLFGLKRFDEVRMDDVAGEASVSKGTLYRYFEDKEELYLALLERANGDIIARMHAVAEGGERPRVKLEAMVRAWVEYFDAQPHLFDLILRAEALLRQGQQFPWQQAREESIRLVQALFTEGQQQGEWNLRDPEIAVLLLLGGVRSFIRFGKLPRPKNYARLIVDSLLHGASSS